MRLGQGPYFLIYFIMKNLFLRTRVNSTIILTAVTTIDVFLPKTTVIFAQGDPEAGTVGISVTALPRRAWELVLKDDPCHWLCAHRLLTSQGCPSHD